MRYVFDLDGVICTQPFESLDYNDARPIASMVARVRELHAAGHDVVIQTARGSESGIDWSGVTARQLARWGVPYAELRFGKPAADVYVDDRSMRPWELVAAPHVDVVAEIGINHNGSLTTALELIEAAHVAGADYVKFQKRSPRLAVPREQWDVPRETPWGVMPYIEYKERLEFGEAEFDAIDRYCRERGIGWFASPWDVESVAFLERYDLPMTKVASASLTDVELLGSIRKTGRPVVLSTGMSTMREVEAAVTALGEGLAVVCHCNSTYPCPPEELNLRCIGTLQRRFPGVRVGYSGHETGLATTVAAVALGASFIERHITLDRSMWGTDQSASVEPQGFARLVRDIRAVSAALGDGEKRVTAGELPALAKLRPSTLRGPQGERAQDERAQGERSKGVKA